MAEAAALAHGEARHRAQPNGGFSAGSGRAVTAVLLPAAESQAASREDGAVALGNAATGVRSPASVRQLGVRRLQPSKPEGFSCMSSKSATRTVQNYADLPIAGRQVSRDKSNRPPCSSLRYAAGGLGDAISGALHRV